MKIKLLFVLGICMSIAAFSQFEPGDEIPSDFIEHVLSLAEPKLDKKHWKNKAILIDFWGRYCGSCIDAMPKVKKIQEEFKDKLLVVYVYGDSTNIVNSFLEKRKDVQPFLLPMLKESPRIANAFPRAGVPHVVWINPNRQVQAITCGEHLTLENVKKWLNSGAIDLPYEPLVQEYEISKPLAANWPDKNLPIIQSSSLTKKIVGLPPRFSVLNTSEKIRKLTANNQPLRSIYEWVGLRKVGMLPSEFKYRIRTDAYADSVFGLHSRICYEYLEPMSGRPDGDKWENRILSDLNLRLGLEARIVEVDMDCFLLQLPAVYDDSSYYIETIAETICNAQPISVIASDMQYYYDPGKLILVDDYSDKRATFIFDRLDRSENRLNELLSKYRATLMPVKRIIRILDIRKV
jgi:thiol-disulfide isomerase/thioredoxin